MVEIAQEYGFELYADDAAIVEAYRTQRSADLCLPSGEAILNALGVAEAMSEICNDATAYLQDRAPDGYAFEWDMGEFGLYAIDEDGERVP